MTARELLDSAMPHLTVEQMQRYVTRYETAPYTIMRHEDKHGDGEGPVPLHCECAVEVMTGNWALLSRHLPHFAAVELVFEGWKSDGTPDPERLPDSRRAVYDACIHELARRASLSVAPISPNASTMTRRQMASKTRT